MSPSLWQILIVVGIFAILFLGPKRLPGIGKSMGEAIRGFKKGITDDEIDVTDSAQETKREQLEEESVAKTSTKAKKEKSKS